MPFPKITVFFLYIKHLDASTSNWSVIIEFLLVGEMCYVVIQICLTVIIMYGFSYTYICTAFVILYEHKQ